MTLVPPSRCTNRRVLPVLWLACVAASQQPTTLQPTSVRVGVLRWGDAADDLAALAGIRDGLRLAGLECTFVEHTADGDVQRGALAAGQLRAADCQLVFAVGTQAALLATASLRSVPVVFAAVADPVASGIVSAWDGSGRNVAGACYRVPPATVLRVFRMALPGLRRIGCLRSLPSGIVSRSELEALRAAAAPGELQIVEAVARDAADIARAVDALRAASVQAIWIPDDRTIVDHLDRVRRRIADLPTPLPLVATSLQAARTEAVVGATVDFELHGRRAAALGVRILRGEAPATMAIDTMQSYLVVANLDAARRCRCELPLSLLAVADELIAPSTAHATRR